MEIIVTSLFWHFDTPWLLKVSSTQRAKYFSALFFCLTRQNKNSRKEISAKAKSGFQIFFYRIYKILKSEGRRKKKRTVMNFSKRLEQDQDVELLVAKDKKYNFKCRNGNWPCEELVEKVSSRNNKITIFNTSYFLAVVIIRIVFNWLWSIATMLHKFSWKLFRCTHKKNFSAENANRKSWKSFWRSENRASCWYKKRHVYLRSFWLPFNRRLWKKLM